MLNTHTILPISSALEPFDEPIYVTSPMLPGLDSFYSGLKDIWESRQLTNGGPKHVELEAKLRSVLKVPHLSLFNNGTIGLIVACQSLRLSGEVITTPFTFPATPHVLSWNNIKPIFCDIDPKTLTINAEKIESLLTPNTTAILGVHVFGNPCNVEQIDAIANKYGLKVIYDAAHAFGTEINGRGIGTYGDISMFSFHATKLFHTFEGGALSYNDPNLKARIDLLKNFGIKNEEEVVMPGINGKMSEVQALMGLANLSCLEQEREKRQQLRDLYLSHLSEIDGIEVVSFSPGIKSSLQYFVIRVKEAQYGLSRDALHQALRSLNVYTRKYFYPLCSDYSCYRQLPSSHPDNLPVARQVVQEVLCLPFYGTLSQANAERICRLIRELPNHGQIPHPFNQQSPGSKGTTEETIQVDN